jgi:hypothetical protein
VGHAGRIARGWPTSRFSLLHSLSRFYIRCRHSGLRLVYCTRSLKFYIHSSRFAFTH